MNHPLDSEDFVLILLAIDLLDGHASHELAKARKAANNAKQATMLNMRSRLIVVRAKVRAMQVAL